MFTERLASLLLQQAGLGSEFTEEPAVPARVGDVLKSKKYWSGAPERWKKYEKSKDLRE